MRKLYNYRLMMLFVIAFVFSGSKLFGQINVTATAGTPTASYTTLNSAFAAINAGTHQGVIDITVIGNTTEPATPTPLVASNGTTVIYSAITIKPSGGNWVINSNAAPTASRGVIELNGADNVTFDGDDLGTPGSQNLTVQVAPLATTGLAAIRLSSTSTTGTDGANNVTVRNLNIIGSRNSATSTVVNYGIVMSNSSAIATGAYSSLNTTIENNVITRCYRGIYANGASATFPNNGLIIRNNLLGSATAADNIGLNAIFVSNSNTVGSANSALIEGNDLRVGDVIATGPGLSASISGIDLGAANSNIRVLRNNIHDIINPASGLWGTYGINLTSATNNDNILIANNFITNIVNCKASTTSFSVFTSYGIRVTAAVTLLNILNNTIVINPSVTGTTANYTNYGIGLTVTGVNVSKIYNNIIVNNNTGTGTFGIASNGTATLTGASLDNNNYFVPSGNIGLYGGANYATLSAWKTATGKDLNTWNVSPNFVSTIDFHIQNGGPASLLESTGATTALTNITTDFDNQTRPGPVGSVNGGATNPDIGADEFDGVPAPIPVVTFGSATPALTTQCATTDPRLISMNVTTSSGLITTVMLNYSINGVAQTPISMVNTSGSTYEATIPAATPLNATVTWNVVATNDAGIVTTYNGTTYQDQPLLGVSALATATLGTVCENTASSVSVSLTSIEPSTAYTTPGVSTPLVDEDLGTVTITQGATTILTNTTTGGSLVGTIGTATGTAGSFSNFTNFGPYAMTAGQTYNFSLTSITQGGNFGNSMAIFIDYNRNGSFTDAGEAVYLPPATVSGPHTETGSFTIPLTALNGKTRMRVYCLETLITSAATTSNWGEYEDYMLNISSANNGGGFSPVITSATWTDGSTTLGTGNPFTVNPAANTTYSATVLSLGCTITSSTTTVNTIPLPDAPLATNSSQCGTQVPTASVTSDAGVAGSGQFYWYNAPTAGTIVQTPPQGPFTTFYSNDFTNTTIGAGASLTGVASLTNVPGQLQLTPAVNSQTGGLVVNAGVNALAYQVDFDFSTNPAGGADGFSYSFANDVNTTAATPSQEMGSGTKFKVSFDAYGAMPNAAGIYLLYNNNAASFNDLSAGVLGYVNNTSWVGAANNHVTIAINQLGQVTLTLNGTTLFTNVQLPAAYLSADKSTWRHAIAGRTGGINMQQTIDNLVIQSAGYGAGSTTYNSLVTATTTFHVAEVGTNGCYSATTPITVTVITPSPVNATISSTLGCVGDSIILEATSAATPPYTYSWEALPSTGAGLTASTGDSIVVAPITSGTYNYVVTATNGTCTATDTVTTTINNIIPFDPTVPTDYLNICEGSTTAPIVANALSNVAGSLATINTGGTGCTNGNMFNVTTGTNPLVLKSADVRPNTTGTQNVLVYYKTGTYLGSETNVGAWTLLGTYSINGTTGVLTNVDFADVNLAANTTYGFYFNFNASYTILASSYSNADMTITTGAGFCTAFSGPIATRTFNGVLHYDRPIPTSISWFPTSTGGTQVGTGSPFETIGTTILPDANTSGTYEFWAAGFTNGCYSDNRALVTVNVTPVNYPVIPIDASCNGNNNGSFSLGTTGCGVAPFEYSVNGSAFTSTIPTDLVAGNYTVIIRDASMDSSAAIPFVIGQPSAPQGLATTTINYFSADVTWTPQGDETSWTVEYGVAGFTPGTGTIIPASTNAATLTNLNANTSYDFYVTADCGTNSAPAGPLTFATDPGFLAWDNSCPPSGFVDISTTGTLNNLTDDAEVGVTMPFNFNYQGVSYNTMTIGNNGGIVFGTLTAQIGFGNAAMSTLATPGLYPFWDDMGGNGAGVFYQTIGTAPNQQFIVQWNREHLSAGGNQLVYQLILDQATNDIYFVYNDVIAGNATYNYGASATIGVSGATDIDVSLNNATYLTNNSCVHFYNALCPNVTNFTSVVSQNDAVLDWNPGLYGETAWTLVYGLAGFDPTNTAEVINTFNLTSSDASFGNTLDQLTEYDVYIYSECAADNLTSDGFFYNFTTLPFCSNPSGITAATDVDSLEAAWNWVEIPGYPISTFNIQYGPIGFSLYDSVSVVANGTNFADTIFDANFMGGGVYQVYVQAVCTDLVNGGIDTSAFIGPITFVMPLTTDLVCGAELLDVNGTVYTFNNTGATVSLNETSIAPPATGAQTTDGWANSTLNNTTWYKFIAPASGSVRINATANNYDGQIAVYSVVNCADFNTNFNLIGANDDAINGTSVAPNFTVCGLTPGDEYYVMHDGFTSTTGVHNISITEIVLQAGLANPLTNICSESTLDLFTTINGYDNGGVWSAPVAVANASITNSTLNSVGLGYQTYTFQYRVTDGCAYDSITSQVKIFAPSAAGDNGTLTVCKNETVDLLTGLNGVYDAGGTWYNPSNVVLTTTLITASPNASSTNYLYVSGNGVCPNDTATVTLVVLSTCDINSIDETVFAGVTVYPNPSTGIIYVDADLAAGNFDYEVTDAKGRVVAVAKKAIKAASTSTIDLRNVETGVYFIRLSNDSADKMFRIVVQ